MKNILKFILLPVILFSCKGGSQHISEKEKSDFFEEIVYRAGGDFNGISVGDMYEEVKEKLNLEEIDDKSRGFIYSSRLNDQYEYYLDFMFDDEQRLYFISAQLYFFNQTQPDSAEARAFFNELKNYFGNQVGHPDQQGNNWFFYRPGAEVEAGQIDHEVYWFISRQQADEI
jgi:hypothetical protein